MTQRSIGKRGRPTPAERRARDARILDAAWELLLERGFAEVSLDAVAARAGVTKRTLYTAFGDKLALLHAVVRRQHSYAGAGDETGQADALPPADAAAPDPVETAVAIGGALLSDEAVALHRLMISEAGRSPELAAEFHEAGPLAAQQHLVTAGLTPDQAETAFTLLLGELHRRRLLGLDAAPSPSSIRTRAAHAVATALAAHPHP
ncbi:TetR/AcrR family transcriptional regulator [Schumannella soli]|uniref:TetR/AcrR family transcriptional regulator n=1 Tax=Schumannella soli TaxID=2590779 RepID=A0A506Y362_9MICO|nr:TetR/AcrR family transcriptional regulator [Schumannella soli]TPW74859.1 TetR/AcrR family transcriptional regulator [Schumannella soli]